VTPRFSPSIPERDRLQPEEETYHRQDEDEESEADFYRNEEPL
jgi:hypothetical protein